MPSALNSCGNYYMDITLGVVLFVRCCVIFVLCQHWLVAGLECSCICGRLPELRCSSSCAQEIRFAKREAGLLQADVSSEPVRCSTRHRIKMKQGLASRIRPAISANYYSLTFCQSPCPVKLPPPLLEGLGTRIASAPSSLLLDVVRLAVEHPANYFPSE